MKNKRMESPEPPPPQIDQNADDETRKRQAMELTYWALSGLGRTRRDAQRQLDRQFYVVLAGLMLVEIVLFLLLGYCS